MDEIIIKSNNIEIKLQKNQINDSFIKCYFDINDTLYLDENISINNFLLLIKYLTNNKNKDDDEIIQLIIIAHKFGIKKLFEKLIIKNIKNWPKIFDKISDLPVECFYDIGYLINDYIPSKFIQNFLDIYKYTFGDIERILNIYFNTNEIKCSDINIFFSSKYYFEKNIYDFNDRNHIIELLNKFKDENIFLYNGLLSIMIISDINELELLSRYIKLTDKYVKILKINKK